MSDLALGFIPLTDCAPLAVAQAKGFFAAEGLAVTLHREASWATIRDKVAVGALDGAHMLAPMTLASTAGLGAAAVPMVAPLALAVNGAAVTLSRALVEALDATSWTPPQIGAALARHLARRAAAGAAPLTLGVVFPYSMHNYALRYWLAASGIDPDRDVRIVVVPPPRMVEQLRAGQVDGVCVGAPWNAVAIGEGLGQIALTTSVFWPGGPDKVLGVTEAFAMEDPARLQALLRALLRAQAWADAGENRPELIGLLAQPDYVGAPPQALLGALGGELVFQRDGASLPRREHALWLLGQMRRWNQLGGEVDAVGLAARVYRPDLALGALAACGLAAQSPPLAALYDGYGFDGRLSA